MPIMRKILCKRCKHKFTLHDPNCKNKQCRCEGFIQKSEQLFVVTHETKEFYQDAKGKHLVFKGTIEHKTDLEENTILNQWLYFDAKKNSWVCRLCSKKGNWRNMRYHGHADSKYYGLTAQDKKVIEKMYGIKIIDKS